MSRPSYTETAHLAREETEFQRAGEVVGQLKAGTQVSPDAMIHAGKGLVDALWRGSVSQLANAQAGLAVLIPALGGVEAQAQVLGEVIAAGANAGPVFDRLVAAGGDAVSVAGMSAAEMQTLRDSLTSPPQERLGTIADMLQGEQSGRQKAPGSPSHSSDGRPEVQALLPTEPSFEHESEKDKSVAAAGPNPETTASDISGRWAAVIQDLTSVQMGGLPDARSRANAAMAMGLHGIPLLGEMLRGNQNEKEMAFPTLVQMGRDPKTARQVHDHLKVLESDPGIRRTAEYIRLCIEDGNGARSGNQRHHAEQANIGDGWLHTALASCDRPEILCAAAGREVYAIPLALRQLAAMRSKRRVEQG